MRRPDDTTSRTARTAETGHAEAIVGCMMAGKTSELIRRIQRSQIAGVDCELYKPVIDDRHGTETITGHNGLEIDAVPVESPTEIRDQTTDPGVVGLDEVQFFAAEPLVETVEALVADGVRIVAAGLDLDFRGEPFSSTRELLARADYVEKLQAVCTVCGDPATRTQRLLDGEPAPSDDDRVLIGADETYEARCRAHHVVPE